MYLLYVFQWALPMIWVISIFHMVRATGPLANGVELRIMPVGDSITHGKQGGSINIDGNGYRRQLWWNITENPKHFVGSQLSGNLPDPYSEGYDGAIIADIATFINASLSSMRPNVVLIHAGTNDMNRPIDPDNAPERLGAMIDEVVSVCPDAAVLVAEIITTNDTAAAALTQTYNAAIPGVVSSRADNGKQVLLVDMSNLLTTAELTDGIHPTDEGYGKMADAWFAGIQEAAQKGWIKEPVALSNAPQGSGCSALPVWNAINEIAVGEGNANLIFADLDGDGKDDYIMVDNNGAPTVYLNAGPTGPGGQIWNAQGEVMESVGAEASQVRFADINGDGKADYLIVHDNGTVDCWINGLSNDTGNFTWTAQGQIVSGSKHDGPGVIFADINGDGRDDYLWVSESGEVTVYLNDASNPPNWIHQGTITTGISANRSQVVLKDLNGDGRADYLVLNESDGSIQAWHNPRNNASNSTWTSLGEIAYGVGVTGSQVRFGDITGSGRSDYLAIENSNGAVNMWQNLCPCNATS